MNDNAKTPGGTRTKGDVLLDIRGLKIDGESDEVWRPIVKGVDISLKRGEEAKTIRPGIDPVQLYVSIAGLCYFYLSNVYTLSVAFGRELLSAPAMEERINHVVDFVLAGVRLKFPNGA